MKTVTSILVAIVLIIGCTSDIDVMMDDVVFDIDPEFEIYVQEFIDEAAKRGQTIDFSDTGLTVQFSEFGLPTANGRCFFASHRIEIDKNDWVSFSPSFRSFLLFHELGHCELRRGHVNDKFLNDGAWRSIMKGDPFTGIENRIPVPYFGFRRDYYLDELFDPGLPTPEWANLVFDYDTPLDRRLVDTIRDVSRIISRPGLPEGDYEFEVNFDLIDRPGTVTQIDWGVQGANYFIAIYPGFGFYAGVKDEGADIFLHYQNNYDLFNGGPIEKITIRSHNGYEQIFLNDMQFFLLDKQERLDFINFSATEDDQILTNFVIDDLTINQIVE